MPTKIKQSMSIGRQAKSQKIPKLRFPGFSGNWEEKKLGEVLKTVPTKSYQIKNTEILKNGKYKVVNQGKNKIAGYSNDPNKLFKNDEVIIFGDHTTILKYIDFDFIVGADGTKILKNKKGNLKYLYYNLDFNNIKSEGYKRHFNILKNIYLQIPAFPEQQKIAEFLGAVDGWIENLCAQKENFEFYKKGMMQKIFAQEIRFKDNKGKNFPAWEEKKLGEIAIFLKGKGISKSDIVENGKNKCIRYGELYTEYNEIIDEVASQTNIKKEDSVLSEKGDLIIPSSGETLLDIATVSYVKDKNIILGGDLNIIRLKENNIGDFFAYYLSNYKKKEIAKFGQGHSVVHLYSSHFKNLKLNIPKKEEQQKIAKFLTSIDNLINSKQQQITQAEQWKKGLMQGLFV